MSFVHQRIEEKTSRKNKRDASKFSTSHDHMIVQATPVDARRRVEWVACEHSELGTIQPRASTRRMGGVGAFRIGNDSATRVDGWLGCIPNWERFSHTNDASNGWRGSIPNWERFSHARRRVEWVAWVHSELGTIQPHQRRVEWVAWVHSELGRVQPHKAGSAFGDAFLFRSGHRSRSWASLNASRYLGYS